DRVSLPLYPYHSYVGIQVPEARGAWGTYHTDTTYRLSVVCIDPKGRPVSGRQLKAQVYKLNHDWWWDGSITGAASYIASPSVELQQEHE
ncbi:MAG: hypothetical protein ACK4L7_01100, partial [Flavobacteriales bacterium]